MPGPDVRSIDSDEGRYVHVYDLCAFLDYAHNLARDAGDEDSEHCAPGIKVAAKLVFEMAFATPHLRPHVT